VKRIIITTLGVALAAAVSVPLSVRNVAAVTQNVCTVNTSPCPSGNLYGLNINSADKQSASLASAHAVLHTSLGDIDCTNSTVSAQSNSDTSNGSVTALAFNNGGTTPCTTTFFGNPSATITVNNLPYTATVARGAACQGGATGCDGTLTTNSINITIRLSNGITCTTTGSPVANLYNKGNANAPVGGSGAAHSEIEYKNASVTVSGSFCPSSGTESAVYYNVGTNPANTDLYLTS